MLTVMELARKSGTTPHAVRYYTRMGLLRPERNPDNGYRLYPPKDVGWVLFIRQAKRLGYTLHEILEVVSEANQGVSPCPKVRKILQRRIVDNRRELERLMALQTRMEQALDQWSDMPDGVPDCRSVCHLIENFEESAQATGGSSGGSGDRSGTDN